MILVSFLSLAGLLLLPFIGSQIIPLGEIFNDPKSNLDSMIFWEIRLPRVLFAFITGIALSLGGLSFQTLFRNPLASPFTLGVASGASLGVTISIFFGIQLSFLAIPSSSIAAFAGALLSMILVYLISKLSNHPSPNSMLLGGVAMTFFFSSAILFMQYFGEVGDSFRIMRWLMGDLSKASYHHLIQATPFVLLGGAVMALHSSELDLLCLDDDLAASRGVCVEKVRILLFLTISLMLAGTITLCGPIGFVGIMVPHICRFLTGATHARLLPMTVILGGLFLAICDTFARSISSTTEIPVGIITSLLGAPFFLFLLFTRHHQTSP